MCDHLGDYSTCTLWYGYNWVRVYDCLSCGARLAMDTLPQRLLRRLYGELYRAPESEPLVPVDFCVTFSGPNALLLARVCFGSLLRTAGSLEGVVFHLVNKDVPPEEFAALAGLIPNDCKCWLYDRPSVPSSLLLEPAYARRGMGMDSLVVDVDWSYRFMTEKCGSVNFVVLANFDLFFVGDFLNLLRSRVTRNTGMLGQHCPFMLLSREAYQSSHFKFRSEGPFKVVPRPGSPGECYLYHPDDLRAVGAALQVGFDAGELLELELRLQGWEVDPLRQEFDRYFYHFSGGGRVYGGDEMVSIRDRATMFIEEYGL